MSDGLVVFMVDRWCHDCCARRVRFFFTARVTNKEKIRSEHLLFRKIKRSGIPFPVELQSWRDSHRASGNHSSLLRIYFIDEQLVTATNTRDRKIMLY
ncbi:hypothetical protein TNCV_3840011 [Trichonephila clavipes]|nr:hypothetical protein TNCV_3840011 [Trichonephila clavipes]